MDKREQRKIKHWLAAPRHAEEVTGNVAATYRYFGIGWPTVYKWRNRYEELGEEGLRDRSSRPHHSHRATKSEVVSKIAYLRQHYHFGPLKVPIYLKRYHDIEIFHSGVWRILDRLGMDRGSNCLRRRGGGQLKRSGRGLGAWRCRNKSGLDGGTSMTSGFGPETRQDTTSRH